MSDIDIALGIDASDAQTGADVINGIFDAITAGAARAMDALAGVSAALGQSSQQSSQSASAAEQAANSQTASFDRLNASMVTLNANMVRLVQTNQNISETLSQGGARLSQTASAADRYGASLANLDARLGLITKSDAAYAQIQGQLNQMLASGAISQDEYATRIDRANEMMDKGALAAQGHAAGLAGISRELVIIGREAVSGDFSRLPGSLLVLTNRMGGLSLGTLGAVAAFGALAAAMAYPVIHAADLDQQMRSITVGLEATGNAANVTAQEIMAMANAISPSTSFSRKDIIGSAQSIASDNVIASNLGVDQLQKLTDAALSFARVTGQEAAPATKQLMQALDGGSASLAELNRQYPIFTATELENLQTMERHGQYAQALGIEVEKLDGYFHGLAQDGMSQSTKSANDLGAAWTGLMDAISKSGPVQQALRDFTLLANKIAQIVGGGESGGIAADRSRVEDLQQRLGLAQSQADGGGLIGILGQGAVSDLSHRLAIAQAELDQKAMVAQVAAAASVAPAGIPSATDLLGSVPSFSFGATTVAGGAAAGGSNVGAGISATQSAAMKQAIDDAHTLAAAYDNVGLAQTLAIAKARDYAGALTQEQKAQADQKWAVDQITIMGQYTASIDAANLATKQQIADTTALAEAWNQSAQAGVVAEATQKALNDLRRFKPDATAADVDPAKVTDQLKLSYEALSKVSGQQLDTLRMQVDTSKDLVDVAGDKELSAYTKITDQAMQQYSHELATAQATADRTGDATELSQVYDKILQTINGQWDIHENGLQVSMKDELAKAQDQLAAAEADLAVGNNRLAVSKEEAAVQAAIVKLKAEGQDINSQDAQQYIETIRRTQEAKDQAALLTKEYQNQQREIQNLGDNIARDMSYGLEQAFQSGGSGWDQMIKGWHHSIDAFLAELISQFAETQLFIPVIEDVVGATGGGTGGVSSRSLGSGGGILSLLSTGSSASGALGGPTIGSSLGDTGLLSSASSYLFGTAGTGVGDIAMPGIAGISADIPGFTIAGGESVAGGSVALPGIEASTISGEGTSGLLGSGGMAASMAPVMGGLAAAGGGFLAGDMVGGAIHSPGLGALAGAGTGAATGAMIGTFILPGIGTVGGAIIGGIAGAIGGALGGQHPTVGPNEGGYVFTQDGVASAGPTGADNGGSTAEAQQLQRATIAGIQSLTAAVGGITNLSAIRVGSFGGKYFGTGNGDGGSPQNAIYDNANDAVANAILESLKHSDLSKVDPNVSTAVQHIQSSTAGNITSAQTISDDLTFAEQFTASVNAMKAGVADFTQAAETAAQATAQKLVTSVEDFKNKAADLGLSAQDAADATKSAVESFLGLSKSQAPSQLEQNVETLYGKLEGVSGLLSEVGIDQAAATQKVKEQVEQMLGITAAAPATGTFAAQMDGLKQTFSDLAPILDKLGISAGDASKALQTAEQNLTTAANDNIQAQLDQLTGGIGSSLQALVTTFKTTFADMQAVGGDLGATQDLMALQISNLYKPQISAAINDVATAFNTQITAEQSLASNAQKAVTSIDQLMQSLKVGSLSSLSPELQLNAAKAQFQKDLQDLHSSDATTSQNAAGALSSDAQAYLTASRSYNASGAGYASDFDYVQSQLQQSASFERGQYDTATKQVTLLQSQLAAITGVQSNTQTIAQATQKLEDLMAQVNSTIASSIKAAGGGAFAGSVSPNGSASTGVSINGPTNFANPSEVGGLVNTIGGYYSGLLGRNASGQELSYYVNLAKGGTSLAQIQQYFLNSPEYLASHSHANGGVASGLSLVGERGPEIADFSSPARIYTNDQLRSALGGGSSNDNGTSGLVQTLRAEMASLRQVVAQVGQQHAELLRVANGYAAASAHAADRAASRPR